jgi:glycine reductase
MTKEIERVGIPIVQMANLVTIAETVGANRIVPTISIPYPLGDPNTTKEEQWKLRRHRVEVAINTLASEIEETTIFEVKI